MIKCVQNKTLSFFLSLFLSFFLTFLSNIRVSSSRGWKHKKGAVISLNIYAVLHPVHVTDKILKQQKALTFPNLTNFLITSLEEYMYLKVGKVFFSSQAIGKILYPGMAKKSPATLDNFRWDPRSNFSPRQGSFWRHRDPFLYTLHIRRKISRRYSYFLIFKFTYCSTILFSRRALQHKVNLCTLSVPHTIYHICIF